MTSDLQRIAEAVRALADSDRGVRPYLAQAAREARRTATSVPSGVPAATAVTVCLDLAAVSLERAGSVLESFAQDAVRFADSLAGGSTDGDGGAKVSSVVAPGPLDSATVRDLLSAAQRTPAGKSFHDDPDMQELAQLVTPQSNQYVVDGHGSVTAFQAGQSLLDAAGLAQVIQSDPDWDGKQPIMLMSCHTGAGPDSLGLQLAQRLHVPVTAPNDLAWSGPDGKPFVTAVDDDGQPLSPYTGKFITFTP